MDKYFFAENNVASQTKKLILNLELPENEINRDVVIKCKKIITNHMKETFNKYGNSKPQKINSKDYMEKLNNKSLSDCLRVINNKTLPTPQQKLPIKSSPKQV